MIEFRKLRDRASRIQYTLSLVLSNACLIYRSLFTLIVCRYQSTWHMISEKEKTKILISHMIQCIKFPTRGIKVNVVSLLGISL